MRRLLRQDQGRADGLGHVPGAARHPHGRLADLEDPRAQDPRHRARHRRRLRQQGRRLFRLHLRHRRLDRDRPAGEMGRGPHREPLDHGVRARLPHDHGDRRDQGRQGHGPARLHHRRPRRLRRLRRPDQMAGRLLQHRDRLVRLPGRACDGRRRLYQQGAGRRRLSLLVPRHRGRLLHRARHGHHGAEARHGPGRAPDEEPDPARAVSLHVGARLGIRFRRLSHRHAARRWTAVGYKQAARRAEGEAGGLQARRDARADGHRRRLLHRDRRRRAVAQLRHPRHRHVRLRRDPHPSDRHRRSRGSAPSRRGRATRPPTPRSSPPSSACPPTTSRSRRATPTRRPTGSAPTARARRRCRAPRPRWRAARSRPRRR